MPDVVIDPAPLEAGNAPHHPHRRPRRGRPQHDELRDRRQDPHRRLRRALPRGAPAGRRPDPARLRVPPGAPRRHRRRRAHARPRGPHRLGALPPAPARRHPADRLHAHARARRGEAQGAPHPAVHPHGARGPARADRPVRPRVHRGQPLDPRRARRRDQDPGGNRARAPATSRWTSCRSTGGSPTSASSRASARRASTCSWSIPPTRMSRASRRSSGPSAPCSTRSSRARRAA